MDISKDPKKTFYFFLIAVLAILSFFIVRNNLLRNFYMRKKIDPEIVQIVKQSDSDEIADIKTDIDNTDLEELDNIEQDLDSIEAEINASI